MGILKLDQFEKITKTRKNVIDAILKEEERIVKALDQLKADGKIDKILYDTLVIVSPIGSQPPRLYGVVKVHKNKVPI